MGLKDRLRRLEGGDPQPCPVCEALLGDVPEGAEGEVYEIVWDELSLYEGEPPEVDHDPDLPEYCPRCGDQLVYVIGWDDD